VPISPFEEVCRIAGIAPTLYLDFTRQDYRIYSPRYGLEKHGLQDLSTILSFTRNSGGAINTPTGKVLTLDEDQPRLDYDPETGICRGLLVEESRTNYFPNTTDTASWSVNINTSYVTGVAGPDGSDNAITITATSSDAVAGHTAATFTVGDSFCTGFYMRRRAGSGTISVRAGPTNSFTVPSLSGSWQFFSYSELLDDPYARLQFLIFTSGDSIDICYPDLQKGSFITSHIPTSGAAATRAADVITIGGSAFEGIWNPSEMSAVSRFKDSVDEVPSYPRVLDMTDGTADNVINLFRSPTGSYFPFIKTEGVNQTAYGGTSSTKKTVPQTISYGFETNGLDWAQDGILLPPDTNLSIPSLNRLNIGGAANRVSISFIALFPRKLTNTKLQQLSSLGA